MRWSEFFRKPQALAVLGFVGQTEIPIIEIDYSATPIIAITVIICYNLVNLATSEKLFLWATVWLCLFSVFLPHRAHTHTHQPPSGPSKCFGCSTATNIPRWKWILQVDSAPQIGLEPTLNGFLIVVAGAWKYLLWLNKFSPPSFERFGCSATTKGAMDKRRPQADSAHQIGLETSLVDFLIVGWWWFIDGWKYWPEFFTPEYLCLLLNNQKSYRQMDDTVGFSALNRSSTDPPWSSDCRLVMLYGGVKIQPSLGGIFLSRNFLFWLVSRQPLILWTNWGHGRIQRIKLV